MLNYIQEKGTGQSSIYTRSGGVPSQGLFRVHSSHITTPRLKMSHFSVNGSFRISSGAIHSGVPADEESFTGTSMKILDSPKSQILTVQFLFTRQFALLRSRWIIFMRCMHISPLYCQQRENSQFVVIKLGNYHYSFKVDRVFNNEMTKMRLVRIS